MAARDFCRQNEKMKLRRKIKEDIKQNINCEEELEVKFIDCFKGSGVFAVKDIGKGKLLTDYKGELISEEEGNRRHGSYTVRDGSFLFFFKYKKKSFCIDATHSSGIGHMINDNHRKPNSKVVVEDKDGHPALCIYSIRQILRGEEICFDYKDPSVPWRKRNAPRHPLYTCPDNSHSIDCMNVPDRVDEQADNKADGLEVQADNNSGCVEERAEYGPDCVEEHVKNKADCVNELADNDPGCVEEWADSDLDCLEESLDRAPSSADLFGTVIVIREKKECDVFAMCSSVLALGSARSSDIIVKNAALHEIILQGNRFGEVFLFHKHTQFSKGHYLKHDEVFPVGGRLFKWKYPLALGKNHGMSCTNSAENEPECAEEWAENDPPYIDEWATNDPACTDNDPEFVEERVNSHPDRVEEHADSDPGCVNELDENDPDFLEESVDGAPLTGKNHGMSCTKSAENEPECAEEWVENDPHYIDEWATNDPGCTDNDPEFVEERVNSHPDHVEEHADSDPGCVKELDENDPDFLEEPVDGAPLTGKNHGMSCTKSAENEPECAEEWAENDPHYIDEWATNDPACTDNDPEFVEERVNSNPDRVEEHADSDPGCVKELDENDPDFLGEPVDGAPLTDNTHGMSCTHSAENDCVVEQADNDPDCVMEQADNDPDFVVEQADNDPDSVVEQADNDPDCVVEQADNDPECVVEQANNDPDCVMEQTDNDPECVMEQADNDPDSVVEQADNDPDSVVEQADNDPDCVVEQADNDPDCVMEQADNDTDSAVEQADNDTDSVVEQGDNDSDCVVDQADNDPECEMEQADNDPDCVVEQADNDPDCVVEQANNDPDCVIEQTDNDPECVVEQADNEPEQEAFDTGSIDDDSVKDPNFSFDDSDEQYISEEDYVSDSEDNSDIIPLFQSLPVQENKRKLDDDCLGTKTKKMKESVQCDLVTSTGIPGRHTDILCDQLNNVKLQPSRNKEGKRVWDKLHYCVFCEESFTNLTKHLFGHHKHEKEVVRISNMPKKSKNRADSLLKIRNAGDYKHNMNVLKNGNGTLITWSRKVGEEHSPTDYLPCEDCLAFFLKGSLWRHRKNCPFRKEKSVNRRIQSAASLLLPVSKRISAGLKENVVKKMLCDEVTMALRNDSLILSVGEKLFQKHGHLEHLNTYISQKMRELGRLLISARRIDPEIQYLSDILVPAKFTKVAVAATRALCKYDDNTNKYGNPSLAMKIGHLLKKCARIKKSASLIAGDSECGKQADDFLDLVENEWTDEVSSCALQTLKANKMNKAQILPLTEDIMKLQAYLENLRNTSIATLQKEFSKSAHDLLNQVTLARLMLFNRRRGGETQRVLLEAYVSKRNRASTPKEVEEYFSPVEKMLCAMFSRVEIRGKKGRTVPVLFTRELESSIDLLLRHRESAGIPVENPYLFPRSNFESKQPIRSSDVLRKFARKAQLSRPEDITSTKLRKHVATISQVLNLSRHDMETMAEFMGHDIDVHREFYRLPQETIQVVKMGRLLSAFDNGTIAQYKGKSLDEIGVEEDKELSSEDDSDLEPDCNDDDGENRFLTKDVVQTHDLQQCSSQNCSRVNVSEDSDDEEQESTVEKTGKRTKPVREKTIYKREVQRLTEDQNKLLKTLFKTNVQLRRELRRADCENVLSKYTVLANLGWKKVKNTIHNWITQEKRKMKQI